MLLQHKHILPHDTLNAYGTPCCPKGQSAATRLHEVARRAGGDIVLAEDELLGHAAAQRHRHLVLKVRAAAKPKNPRLAPTVCSKSYGCGTCSQNLPRLQSVRRATAVAHAMITCPDHSLFEELRLWHVQSKLAATTTVPRLSYSKQAQAARPLSTLHTSYQIHAGMLRTHSLAPKCRTRQAHTCTGRTPGAPRRARRR